MHTCDMKSRMCDIKTALPFPCMERHMPRATACPLKLHNPTGLPWPPPGVPPPGAQNRGSSISHSRSVDLPARAHLPGAQEHGVPRRLLPLQSVQASVSVRQRPGMDPGGTAKA
jgi:hypothetical protein